MTRHFLIDGYNLLFRTTSRLDADSFTKGREMAVEELSLLIKQAELSATLLFDAKWKEGPEEKQIKNDLELLYTEWGESADDRIVREVKHAQKPKELIVVTSDRKLAWRVRMKGAQAVSVEEFLKELKRIAKKKLLPPKPAPAKPAPPLVKKPPTLNERYEKLFESNAEEEKPKKKKEPKFQESDYERWLKAFENGA